MTGTTRSPWTVSSAKAEPEAAELLEGVLRAEGIDVHVGARIESIRHSMGTLAVDLGGLTLRAGRLLVAAGRTTNLESLGVSALGWILPPASWQGALPTCPCTRHPSPPRTSWARVLVGATSAGPAGGEVLAVLALAVHARIPVITLRRMLYTYPTFHRASEGALDRLE